MRFAPRPENDFADYIRTYYRECRYRFEKIEAIAGKWMFRDLVPGLSDFDPRFIVNEKMTADEWSNMSTAVGEAHLALCRKYPAWARNLEHLPGINLTWAELTSERSYYSEFQQWTYYHCEHPVRISEALDHFARRPWDAKDEYFHLKKFCLYYGRYNRSVDPPINLTVQANKYPLHSRLMHYFNPPVMSAVCLLDRNHFVGKLESFERACQLFPKLRCWAMIEEILHAGYEIPKWYHESRLLELEDAMQEALQAMAASLRTVITLVPPSASLDLAAWKQALEDTPVDPAMLIFDNAKFARLMKGRLWFYAQAPAFFETAWLIRNELGRIGQNFFRVPFRTYWKTRTGQSLQDPAAILDQLAGALLTYADVQAVREFNRLSSASIPPGQEKHVAMDLVAIFDSFFAALSKISEAV